MRAAIITCAVVAGGLFLAGASRSAPATGPATAPAEEVAPAGFDQPRDVPHGKVATEEYDSKSLGFRRKAVVYTPPGYAADQKFPVLYLLHGAGDDETGWVQKGAAAVILDNLYAAGKVRAMIVVMPYGYPAKAGDPPRNPNATPEERQKASAAWAQDLLTDLIPFVESRMK